MLHWIPNNLRYTSPASSPVSLFGILVANLSHYLHLWNMIHGQGSAGSPLRFPRRAVENSSFQFISTPSLNYSHTYSTQELHQTFLSSRRRPIYSCRRIALQLFNRLQFLCQSTQSPKLKPFVSTYLSCVRPPLLVPVSAEIPGIPYNPVLDHVPGIKRALTWDCAAPLECCGGGGWRRGMWAL